MSGETSIRYFNRYTGTIEDEEIYGERYLRWIYGTRAGRLCLEGLVKRLWFSRWYGWRMRRPSSRRKVQPFVDRYRLDAEEFLRPSSAYESFDDFFSRRLRPEARPVDPAPDTLVFPADGRHFAVDDIAAMTGLFVKGQRFDLAALLGDTSLAEKFGNGSLVVSRLCPLDYHRYHFPVSGKPGVPSPLGGALYSVSPLALRRQLGYLWRNKRVLTALDSDRCGTVLILEVGATCVGSIVSTFTPEKPVRKGREKGYFRFGGSTVITLFEPGRVQLDGDLLQYSGRGLELYARMGDRMGTARAG